VITRHAIARAMMLCLLLVLLSSCVATPTSVAPTPPAEPAAGGVTLLLWHGWSGSDRLVLSRLVDQFNVRHPDGRVLLQSVPLATFGEALREAVVAGSGPHLVLIPNTWIGGLAELGVVQPIDDLIPPAERRGLLAATIGGAQVRDRDGVQRLYGLPISFDTLALYYNTANVIDSPDDTTELIALAHGLSDPNATPPRWGLALNLSLDNTIGYLYAFGGRIFDDQGQLVLAGAGREGTERWLSWLLELSTDQRVLARDNSIQIDRVLKNGYALMTFDWSHQFAAYRSLWGEQLGVASLPRLSATNQPPQPYVASELLALNSRAGPQERAAAAIFMRFMLSEQAQRELLTSTLQPARGDLALDGPGPELAAARAFRAQADQGLPMPNSATRDIVWQELKRMQQHVLMGIASPSDAVTEADARLRERLQLPGP
jgi:maltose-binding protein MalE